MKGERGTDGRKGTPGDPVSGASNQIVGMLKRNNLMPSVKPLSCWNAKMQQLNTKSFED